MDIKTQVTEGQNGKKKKSSSWSALHHFYSKRNIKTNSRCFALLTTNGSAINSSATEAKRTEYWRGNWESLNITEVVA
jgi:hypothetical protein